MPGPQLGCGEAAHGPGLLLLDEPTSSLDLRHQIDLVVPHHGAKVADDVPAITITADLIRKVFEIDVGVQRQ